ncbi:MAG: hypothetical protein LBQ66_06970 [Planctomycetaceae bacterium]|nr:hypothetical protein [Planctomycetaceae bacterium]
MVCILIARFFGWCFVAGSLIYFLGVELSGVRLGCFFVPAKPTEMLDLV